MEHANGSRPLELVLLTCSKVPPTNKIIKANSSPASFASDDDDDATVTKLDSVEGTSAKNFSSPLLAARSLSPFQNPRTKLSSHRLSLQINRDEERQLKSGKSLPASPLYRPRLDHNLLHRKQQHKVSTSSKWHPPTAGCLPTDRKGSFRK